MEGYCQAPDGPSTWPELCRTGDKQSPINLPRSGRFFSLHFFLNQVDFSLYTSSQIRQIFLLTHLPRSGRFFSRYFFLDRVDFSLHTSSQIRQIFLFILLPRSGRFFSSYFFLDQVDSSLHTSSQIRYILLFILLPRSGIFFSLYFFLDQVYSSLHTSSQIRYILFFKLLISLLTSHFASSYQLPRFLLYPSLFSSSSSYVFSLSLHLLLSARIHPDNPFPILCMYCQGQRRL